MRHEDVLAAIATGLWRWDNAAGTVTVDAEAARLLGLPQEETVLTTAEVRARLHPVDWNETEGIVQLALSEDRLAEARVRIVDLNGEVQRTVRSRSRPYTRPGPDGSVYYELLGTLQEVAEPQPGATVEGTAVTGDWRRSREAFLLDAGRALAEARSTAEVLRVASSLSMPGFSPDALAVFSAAGEELRIIGIQGNTAADADEFPDLLIGSDYPASEVIRTGRAIYLSSPEAYATRYPAIWPSIAVFDRSSWAFLPLIVAGRTLGTWMAAFKHRVTFSPDERSVLSTVARMLAQALARAEITENERELSLALQRSMMPTIGPDIPGMSVAARYVPTGGGLQVGGDWYDMIPLPGPGPHDEDGEGGGSGGGGRFAMVIGDVQGHDVRAAGLMGQLRIALRAYASEGHSPDAVLSRASRFLAGLQHYPGTGPDPDVEAEDRPVFGVTRGPNISTRDYDARAPRFATCLYLVVDPATGTLDIARAGHPDPILRMADGTAVVRQTAGGLPLGIETDADYPTTRLVLGRGEMVMLCTDGLIETGGHDLDSGWERLRPVLETTDGSMENLADALVESVVGPTSHYTTGPLSERREDDIALLLLARDAAPARPLTPPTRRTAMSIAQAEPERIADARRQLRDLLHDWANEDQIDSAALMVSEMVTNVLVHTDGDALLTAEVAGRRGTRRLRVEVADSSDEQPHRRRPGELASSGRGLVLMEVLAKAWGVDPRGEGKTIWFELYEDEVEPASASEEAP